MRCNARRILVHERKFQWRENGCRPLRFPLHELTVHQVAIEPKECVKQQEGHLF